MLSLGVTHSARALQCPEFPRQLDHDISGEAEGKISALKGLESGELKAKFASVARDMFAGHPQEPRDKIVHTIIAMMCSALRDDDSLSEAKKREGLAAINAEVHALLGVDRGADRAPSAPPPPAPPPPAPSKPAQQGQQRSRRVHREPSQRREGAASNSQVPATSAQLPASQPVAVRGLCGGNDAGSQPTEQAVSDAITRAWSLLRDGYPGDAKVVAVAALQDYAHERRLLVIAAEAEARSELWVDAFRRLDAVLFHMGDDPWIAAQRACLDDERRAWSKHVAFVDLSFTPGEASVELDDSHVEPVVSEPGHRVWAVGPGKHALNVGARGYASAQRSVDAFVGGRVWVKLQLRSELDVALAPTPSTRVDASQPEAGDTLTTAAAWTFWAAIGLGAVGVAGAVYFHQKATAATEVFRGQCMPRGSCSPDMIAQAVADSGVNTYDDWSTALVVTAGVSGALAAAAGVVWLVRRSRFAASRGDVAMVMSGSTAQVRITF